MANKPWLLESPSRPLGDHAVGAAYPVYITGEIGINHNGDLANAIALIDQAADAGCDAVKFQKRTPEICTPGDQWDIERDTPWGRMRYIDYRHRMEFGIQEYAAIDEHAKHRGIAWFASPWDIESVDFMEAFDVPAHKVASACLTDDDLLRRLRATGRTIILSTGMSTMRQIRHAVEVLGSDNIILCHATSTYPAPTDELNLKMIHTLQGEFPNVPIGYPPRDRACKRRLPPSPWVRSSWRRHITLTARCGAPTRPRRSSPQALGLWCATSGDQRGHGDGVKRVYDGERTAMKKLRRVPGELADQADLAAVS
jgi:N-acetylneuraminate synthase